MKVFYEERPNKWFVEISANKNIAFITAEKEDSSKTFGGVYFKKELKEFIDSLTEIHEKMEEV